MRKPLMAPEELLNLDGGNPYHPPLDRVTVTDDLGRKHSRPVIREPVPDRFAHLPQYRGGMWSYIRENGDA